MWPRFIPTAIVVIGCGTATVIELIASGKLNANPNSALYTFAWLIDGFLGAGILLGLSLTTGDSIRRGMPEAEFLPDDEVTRWTKWQQDWPDGQNWLAG